ncbi:MAG: NADH-quinone oxidoreductase subunit C [Ginsengibacter sp.]
MSLTNEIIRQRLSEKFGEELTDWEEPYGMLSFSSDKNLNLKVLQYLFDEPSLGFQFLTDICGVHFPNNEGKELCVVYHLHNLTENVRIRYKVYTNINKPDVFSAYALYSAANWMERETYDFFGVNFVGHPNLKRILNVEEMEYFPLRREYPLEDQKRVDKDDDMFGR